MGLLGNKIVHYWNDKVRNYDVLWYVPFEKEVIRAIEESGLKALVGEGIFDFPSPSYGPLEKGFELTEELLKNFKIIPELK